MVLLSVENLSKKFPVNKIGIESYKSSTTALNNITFQINQGETLALIGESGSGKTTLARCILRFIPPDKGRILYQDRDILQLSAKKFRILQPKFQMIFQNPALALNPRQTVGETIGEPLKVINGLKGLALHKRILQLLEMSGLESDLISRLPRQLSGGQQQRVVIARALAPEPEFIIADEPTSSIDAVFKKQIMQLLKGLQKKLGLTLLLISHDLDLVADISDRTAVLYKGSLVEIGRTDLVVKSQLHPYTHQLLKFSHYDDLESLSFGNVTGRNDSSAKGCIFKEECAFVKEECLNICPDRSSVSEEHSVACHFSFDFGLREVNTLTGSES